MIYISYGVSKSASTYIYQLTEEILRVAGRHQAKLSTRIKGHPHKENYVEQMTGEVLDDARAEIGELDVVIKTHSAPDARVLADVAAGRVLASAIIRDPREIALSMIDHGKRAQTLGLKDFTEFKEPLNVVNNLKGQIVRFDKWVSCDKVAVFTYDQVSFHTSRAVERLAAQIGVAVDPQTVIAPFKAKSMIGQFNKGQKNRYLELTPLEQGIFESTFPQFYRDRLFFCERAETN
jgi:hypothetical protein